ncbi:hypothetical protein CFB3_00240 [Clostridium folliculivorans]|uniref:Putative Se/S carrier protein-like domain-containing protein n=2 Tax=Clostridium folliculivorans TaxID=2886038 RepID=A0A9W6DBE9_9CLOT|nr:DUF3343 domain-containing protein [Clostridium folliculivorans]GKU25832.1 hypothetical protein CFOLD11_26580 [Clostridium folliculivorans]GKU27918.1 hypothetical protein CFB3_00240 [Clostridium folliculivorans]
MLYFDKANIFMKEYIMVFKNTHDAIGAEKFIKSNELEVVVMPTPTYITQSCGICIKLNDTVLSAIECELNNKINFKSIYLIGNEGLKLYK